MEGNRSCKSRSNDNLTATFDVAGEVTSSSPEWKKCDVIAKVIANCPSQAKSVEEYYKLVSPQVSYNCSQAVVAIQAKKMNDKQYIYKWETTPKSYTSSEFKVLTTSNQRLA